MGRGRGRRIDVSLRNTTIKSINEARAAGSSLKAACDALGISKRTYERWQKNPGGDRRKGPLSNPANKLTESERQLVLNTANSIEFMDKSPAQIVPKLADRGDYIASESTFYRILKAEGLIVHRGKSKAASQSRNKPDELVASGPNQVYSWDITYLKTNVTGIFLYLYLVMDVYSRKVVGFTVQKEQNSEHAATMMKKICREEGVESGQLTLHSDNGSPMKGATLLATLQRIGVMPSFSRPSVSDDNPYSESLFKTLKYCPMYPTKPFDDRLAAQSWVKSFVRWYNEEHLHSGIKFVTPGARHRGEDKEILMERKKIYEKAKQKNPKRWSKGIRNWEKIDEVFLNPLKEKLDSCSRKAA